MAERRETAITEAARLPAVLATLRREPVPPGGVLSVYLDTSPARAEDQAYLLAYRDCCREVRAALSNHERVGFDAAAARVERYLTDTLEPGRPGVAVFAAAAPGYFHAVALPERPADHIRWAPEPELEPLQAILDDHERVAVVLLDKERARLFTVYLGEIEAKRTVEDYVPGKHATGGWFALAQSRYARHHEDHVLRHIKRTIAALMQMLRLYPFDRLLVGGPDEAVAMLQHHLPRPLRSRLAGTVALELFASDHAVLEAVRQVTEALERQAEVAAVQALLDAIGTPRAALGFADTLIALNEGRVHVLYLVEDFEGVGGVCRTCGALVPGLQACLMCGGEAEVVGNLRERLVAAALQQGARIEAVGGEAAALLRLHNGIGAWTRY